MNATEEQSEALRIASELIEAGIPVFAAPPCPAANGGTCGRDGHVGQEEYDLPAKWQQTVPSKVWLERWQPGWGLGAVGGHVADFLDEDPRNGGSASVDELKASGHWPRLFGIQQTPSGGYHYIISPMRERKGELMPGLDYQGGAPDGAGRGFVWIAPTVKRSKAAENAGQRSTYRWLEHPDLDYLAEFRGEGGEITDDSIDGVRDRLIAKRAAKARTNDPREAREFTEAEARQFCDITLQRLMKAEIGQIEESANAAAAQLSHFVPEFWSEEFAHSVLMAALGSTAYDPDRPGATWNADKFRKVLAGTDDRAPNDWKAIRRPETVAEVAAEPDEVDALLAEMLPAERISELPAPRPLIKGLLDMDSECWLIGQPGSKKSFVALDMAGHVGRGMSWQGLKTAQGEVVMIVAEGASGVSKRVRAWNKQYGQMTGVRMLPRPVQARDLKAWAVLVEACRRIKPVLVIIDTQARVTLGLKENAAEDMGVYNEAVRVIREATGACVLTLHHTGKDGEDTRGSSALNGAQGSRLKVEKTGALSAALVTGKQKDMAELDKIPLHFAKHDLELDEDGEPVTSLVLLGPDAYRDASGVTVAEVGQEMRVSEPEEWTRELVPHHKSENTRRILQVLAEVAGDTGITKSEVCRIIRGRWYGGRPLDSNRAGHLSADTWERSWTAARDLERPVGGGLEPEKVLTNPGGERWSVAPQFLPDR